MALSEFEKKAIMKLSSKLYRNYPLNDFIVFGSKAMDTDVMDSDIDVMILLDHTSQAIESEIDDLIFDINLEYDCLISAVFFSREELENGPLDQSPVYKKAMAEGTRV